MTIVIGYPVLALDIATNTGWAFGVPGETPKYGHINLGNEQDRGAKFSLLDTWLSDFITDTPPALIAAELPNIVSSNGIFSTLLSCGLQAVAELAAWRREILFVQVSSKAACKTFTGDGSGKSKDIKRRIGMRCNYFGWQPETQDAADALAIWYHTCKVIVPKIEEAV